MGQNNVKIASTPYSCDAVAKVVAPRPGVQEVVLLAVEVPKVAVKACRRASGTRPDRICHILCRSLGHQRGHGHQAEPITGVHEMEWS